MPLLGGLHTADSNKLEDGPGRIYAGVPSFFALRLEDGHVPNFLASTAVSPGSSTCCRVAAWK